MEKEEGGNGVMWAERMGMAQGGRQMTLTCEKNKAVKVAIFN